MYIKGPSLSLARALSLYVYVCMLASVSSTYIRMYIRIYRYTPSHTHTPPPYPVSYFVYNGATSSVLVTQSAREPHRPPRTGRRATPAPMLQPYRRSVVSRPRHLAPPRRTYHQHSWYTYTPAPVSTIVWSVTVITTRKLLVTSTTHHLSHTQRTRKCQSYSIVHRTARTYINNSY